MPRDAVSCGWLAGDVERIERALHLTHGADAPEATRFLGKITAEDKAQVAAALSHQHTITVAETYLITTDWYLIRQTETGKPMPAAVKKRRSAARKLLSANRS